MDGLTTKHPMGFEMRLAKRPVALAAAILGAGVVLVAAPGASLAQMTPGAPSAAPKTAAPDPSASSASASCDAACIRAHSDAAARACAPQIESKAPGDFEWVSRPYGNIFQEAESAGSGRVVNYRGDSVRFQSPQREWVRVSYECAYDAAQGGVVQVNVRLGRLHAAAPPPKQATEAAKPQSQPRASTTSHAKRIRVGEPSEVEVMQVTPNTIQR